MIKRPLVLDVCCGSQAFWFSKSDNRGLFIDKRIAVIPRVHADRPRSPVVIKPDVQASFTNLPFKDEIFALVVFDPPHILGNSTGNVAKYYGILDEDWRTQIAEGFEECFRVLKKDGTLIFKWSETSIKLKELIPLAKHRPLFGNKQPKSAGTHWIVFLK